MKDEIAKRGKALEGSFFQERDRQLLDDLRKQMSAEQRREALAAATGIRDEQALNQLVESGIDSRALAALALYPLVAVAWADDDMAPSEREAISKAAADDGLAVDGPAHAVLAGWLDHKPEPDLLDAWKQYARGLAEELDQQQLQSLRDHVIGRARRVAEAAGGILGIGKISAAESEVLEDLQQALT